MRWEGLLADMSWAVNGRPEPSSAAFGPVAQQIHGLVYSLGLNVFLDAVHMLAGQGRWLPPFLRQQRAMVSRCHNAIPCQRHRH